MGKYDRVMSMVDTSSFVLLSGVKNARDGMMQCSQDAMSTRLCRDDDQCTNPHCPFFHLREGPLIPSDLFIVSETEAESSSDSGDLSESSTDSNYSVDSHSSLSSSSSSFIPRGTPRSRRGSHSPTRQIQMASRTPVRFNASKMFSSPEPSTPSPPLITNNNNRQKKHRNMNRKQKPISNFVKQAYKPRFGRSSRRNNNNTPRVPKKNMRKSNKKKFTPKRVVNHMIKPNFAVKSVNVKPNFNVRSVTRTYQSQQSHSSSNGGFASRCAPQQGFEGYSQQIYHNNNVRFAVAR